MYRGDIDGLKGVSILAIVLFHIGLLKSGYLGVDVFFVINGFLVIPSILKKIETGEFGFLSFMEKRVLRLLPLIVVASILCLLVGAIGMLPDNFENLAESVVASNFFSENILSAITTKNYWDTANDYKPLMHLWYIGILFEFYITFPLIILFFKYIIKKIKKNEGNISLYVVSSMFAISLALYCLPFNSVSDKFYLVPFRYFEIVLGGFVGLSITDKAVTYKSWWMPLVLLLFVLFSSIVTFDINSIGNQVPVIGGHNIVKNELITDKTCLLLLTISFTAIVLLQNNYNSLILNNKIIIAIGKRCYSIFIWHQILLAFYRYFYSDEITILFIILYVISICIISELSYRFIEQKIKYTHCSFFSWTSIAIFTSVIACTIYLHAGVIRDVPEQNIKFNDVHRGMHAEYCDRVYSYDKDFQNGNDKLNILIEGISFGRDFANCLLESNFADKVNISYIYTWDKKYINRVKEADFIFSFTSKVDVPQYVWENKKNQAEIWGIGTKCYGKSNGIIYRHRNQPNYFETVITPNEGYVALNNQWKEEWGEKYIDFMQMATNNSGKIRVFTPDGKFISQDCRHLTKEGAQWYGKIIDWQTIFSGYDKFSEDY